MGMSKPIYYRSTTVVCMEEIINSPLHREGLCMTKEGVGFYEEVIHRSKSKEIVKLTGWSEDWVKEKIK